MLQSSYFLTVIQSTIIIMTLTLIDLYTSI